MRVRTPSGTCRRVYGFAVQVGDGAALENLRVDGGVDGENAVLASQVCHDVAQVVDARHSYLRHQMFAGGSHPTDGAESRKMVT